MKGSVYNYYVFHFKKNPRLKKHFAGDFD